MPELLARFQGGSTARAAAIGGYLSLAFATMPFVFSPILSALSDRYSRRPNLLGSLSLASADYLMMAMAPYLWMIFVGRVLSGASSATLSVANAYLADRSFKEDRTKFFGYVGAAAGIGFVMGPFIGGLLGTYAPPAPFYAASALSLVALVGTLGNLNVTALGLSLGVAGFLTLVWLQSGLFALILLPIFSFRAIVGIAIVGESSAQVDPDWQGELQGTFASLGAFASLVSFPMMTQLFASQLSNGESANTWHSGAPFLLAAGLALLLLIVTVKPAPATKGGHASKNAQ